MVERATEDLRSPPNTSSSTAHARTSIRTTLPPAYDDYVPRPPFTRLGIKAYDTPQWLWTNAQCQAWITAYCVEMLSFDLSRAEGIARDFRGAGTTIYTMKIEFWKRRMGELEGITIFNYLCSVFRKDGAVPDHIMIPHFPEGR
jgi:hypothetical protein